MPSRVLALVLVLATFPASAAARYHLELEANPAAAFPYLSKFGTAIEVHVYASGVRAEALWLDSFSKNDAPGVTVANPLGRMYVDVPVGEIASVLHKLAGSEAGVEKSAVPIRGPILKGTVRGIAATRHRLVYGPEAWIDIWTTDAIPPNPQYRRIADQILGGIAPGTAPLARTIPGTPIHVELNFRRFEKVPILKVKQLTFDVSAEDEQEALELGRIYVRAPLLDRLFRD